MNRVKSQEKLNEFSYFPLTAFSPLYGYQNCHRHRFHFEETNKKKIVSSGKMNQDTYTLTIFRVSKGHVLKKSFSQSFDI